jgi:thiosulfate dehydrogenase [quinone] large subunit
VAGVATRSTDPIIDDHIVQALILLGFALTNAGLYVGLGRWWQNLPFVKKYPWLA